MSKEMLQRAGVAGALLVLFSAMLDPRVSLVLALLFLAGLLTLTFTQIGRK